ncbi:uncharacterized protein C8Q71DRAFT_43368 [Rhodofomes roseus]|uniref:Secreted protein n=1 Tax=Rhodofomes roseus TaxID=34475 RepID=A0ABQ8KFW2_9APHY|nr:uncharacterized protein C8Q71DRAFT_43368 [Rhodofomes roseus]KAH9836467.1 hypothetical protein C8Q71DRAFT_43368 [Rhodofomes roseus]
MHKKNSMATVLSPLVTLAAVRHHAQDSYILLFVGVLLESRALPVSSAVFVGENERHSSSGSLHPIVEASITHHQGLSLALQQDRLSSPNAYKEVIHLVFISPTPSGSLPLVLRWVHVFKLSACVCRCEQQRASC